MLKQLTVFSALALLGLPLAACGTTDKERGLSGAGIGAATGAAGAAVTDQNVLGGAALGGAAGAATGVLTDEEDINLEDTFD